MYTYVIKPILSFLPNSYIFMRYSSFANSTKNNNESETTETCDIFYGNVMQASPNLANFLVN